MRAFGCVCVVCRLGCESAFNVMCVSVCGGGQPGGRFPEGCVLLHGQGYCVRRERVGRKVETHMHTQYPATPVNTHMQVV